MGANQKNIDDKSSWVREPVVAGRFYPGSPTSLTASLKEFLTPAPSRLIAPLAIFAPHAGYIYSGKIAGDVYKSIEVPDSVILLCPNHTGQGAKMALWGKGRWKTPLGDVPVDETLSAEILKAAPGRVILEKTAHLDEHAIEVHLPFLLTRNPNVSIVPLTLGRLRIDDIEALGKAIATAITASQKTVLIVASTDMSHYLPAKVAAEADRPALEKIGAMDPQGLYETVVKNGISMCGFIPTATALMAAKLLGARHAELVTYGHSGERSGDFTSVVAYASGFIT